MKRAHYLQHVEFEGLAAIEPWLEQNDFSISASRLYLGEPLPAAEDCDLLIIMGGPMSVHDEVEFPWLMAEKQFIRQVIERGVAVLGICLGAQLIAEVMGGSVYPNRHKEIGWFPVQRAVQAAENPVFQFPAQTMVFHWHGETFTLPDNAVLLASSEACSNQAFQLGPNVIGLQFHLETTPESASAILHHCEHELVTAPYIQQTQAIKQVEPAQYVVLNEVLSAILAYLTR